MKKSNRFIYAPPTDALVYMMLFLLSFIIPAIIEIQKDPFSFSVLIFINSAIILREYGLLWKNKDVSRAYWWKRLIGFSCSLVTGIFSLIFILYEKVAEIIEVPSVLLLLACIPFAIALIELIMYLRIEYIDLFGNKEQAIKKRQEVTVVNSNTIRK